MNIARRIRILLVVAVAAVTGLSLPSPSVAQERPPPRFALAEPPTEPMFAAAPPALQPAHERTSTAVLWLSGVLGGVGGMLVGGLAGAGIACARPDAGSYCAFGAFPGALVGEVVGLPLAIHLANGRKGNFALELLGSAGVAALGIALAAGMAPLAPVIVLAIPVVQIVAVINVETPSRRASPSSGG